MAVKCARVFALYSKGHLILCRLLNAKLALCAPLMSLNVAVNYRPVMQFN